MRDLTSEDPDLDPERIEDDFCALKGIDPEEDGDVIVSAVFEHGHWWISVDPDTADTYGLCTTYNVVDTSNGFDYEGC